MGWTWAGYYSRKDLIDDLVRDTNWKSENGEKSIFRDCLKHCYRGNSYCGILWMVWQVTTADPTKKESTVRRFIACSKIRFDKRSGEWGHLDMDETEGPCYYSCPLSYLDMTPAPESQYAKSWRSMVRRAAEKRKRKITKGFTYKATNGTVFGKGKAKTKVLTIRVLSLRPMRGRITCEDGREATVKFTKACIGDETVPMTMWKKSSQG